MLETFLNSRKLPQKLMEKLSLLFDKEKFQQLVFDRICCCNKFCNNPKRERTCNCALKKELKLEDNLYNPCFPFCNKEGVFFYEYFLEHRFEAIILNNNKKAVNLNELLSDRFYFYTLDYIKNKDEKERAEAQLNSISEEEVLFARSYLTYLGSSKFVIYQQYKNIIEYIHNDKLSFSLIEKRFGYLYGTEEEIRKQYNRAVGYEVIKFCRKEGFLPISCSKFINLIERYFHNQIEVES